MWVGLGISGGCLLVLFIVESSLGRFDLLLADDDFDVLANVSTGILRDIRIAIVHCLIIGYLPAAFLHVIRRGRSTVLVLQDALDWTREECETLAASVKLDPRGFVFFGVVGFVVAIYTPYLVPPVPPDLWNPAGGSAEVAWHRILGPLTMMWAFWLGYAVITVSLRMSRIAERLSHINLLDLSSLTPFAQLGLTNALMGIGILSIWSLMMIEEGFDRMMWIIGGTTLITAALVLVAPVRGVHRRIVQAKDAELAWVNAEIAKRRGEYDRPASDRPSGELADLVTYRSMIDDVPEWPFTTTTYARFVLYALLPVLSWGIGIVAEELVGRALF